MCAICSGTIWTPYSSCVRRSTQDSLPCHRGAWGGGGVVYYVTRPDYLLFPRYCRTPHTSSVDSALYDSLGRFPVHQVNLRVPRALFFPWVLYTAVSTHVLCSHALYGRIRDAHTSQRRTGCTGWAPAVCLSSTAAVSHKHRCRCLRTSSREAS